MSGTTPPPSAAVQPLVPRTPTAGFVAGSAGAGILAAVGWLAQEIITLEKQVATTVERVAIMTQSQQGQIGKSAMDIDHMRERLILLERAVLSIESQQRRANPPEAP